MTSSPSAERVGVAAEEADVFVVDVDVDEAAELAVLVLDLLRARGMRVELGEQAGEVGGCGLKLLLSVGVAGQRGGRTTLMGTCSCFWSCSSRKDRSCADKFGVGDGVDLRM